MEDPYRRSAEFVDSMSRDAWRTLGPIVADAIRGAEGPVVDLGAGTGLATLVAADILPEAEILAIEPSPALRAVLLAKLADRPENDGPFAETKDLIVGWMVIDVRSTSGSRCARSTPSSPRPPSEGVAASNGS